MLHDGFEERQQVFGRISLFAVRDALARIGVNHREVKLVFGRMVEPASRPRSLESLTRSTNALLGGKMPLCLSMALAKVVLPVSTCAMMAMVGIALLIIPVFRGARAPTPVKTEMAAETT